MLPLRYTGLLHCCGLMWREEGLKGIYRGYLAYLLAVFNLLFLTIKLFIDISIYYSNTGLD